MPRGRHGEFSTALFERYARSEKALVAALAEMYLQGVSTRKLKVITEELCGHSCSASAIPAINKGLDATLAKFAHRPLEEAYPCVPYLEKTVCSSMWHPASGIRHPAIPPIKRPGLPAPRPFSDKEFDNPAV